LYQIYFRLNNDLQDVTKFNPDDIVNYLFVRLLVKNSKLVPIPNTESNSVSNKFERILIKSSGSNALDPFDTLDGTSNPKLECVKQLNSFYGGFRFASARVFVEGVYPSEAARTNIQT